MDRDGIDVEVIFPNKGLSMWATPDPVFAMAQCRVYNDWAWETFGPYNDRMSPAAAIATGDLEGSIAEVQRVAKLGFRALTLPCKPIWGGHDVDHPNYNLPMFDPLWTVIQDANLPITFHVSTGRDPRAARGNGGAVINYVSHSLSPTIEPVANLCASGVLRALPAPALRHDRGRHRLGAVVPRRDGRGLPQASLLGAARSSGACRASTSASTAWPRSRRIRPGSRSPSRWAWSTTSCGATTIRTTRARGRTRPRRSSGRWAISPSRRGPTCSG